MLLSVKENYSNTKNKEWKWKLKYVLPKSPIFSSYFLWWCLQTVWMINIIRQLTSNVFVTTAHFQKWSRHHEDKKVNFQLSLLWLIYFLAERTSLHLCLDLFSWAQFSFAIKVWRKKRYRSAHLLCDESIAVRFRILSWVTLWKKSNNSSLRLHRCHANAILIFHLLPVRSLFVTFLICPDGLIPMRTPSRSFNRTNHDGSHSI